MFKVIRTGIHGYFVRLRNAGVSASCLCLWKVSVLKFFPNFRMCVLPVTTAVGEGSRT